MSTPIPPDWSHCGHGADPATDPIGCRGIHVPGHTACLAHLPDADRTSYLTSLAPGADIDHRGTPFTEPLLEALLNAVRDPTTAKPHLGTARFDRVQFSGGAWFHEAQFSSSAFFGWAQFSGAAGFDRVQFSDDAQFGGAQFSSAAFFGEAQFSSSADFTGAQFSGAAGFSRAQFSGAAKFGEAQFSSFAWFGEARFSHTAWFGGTRFSGNADLGRARFEGVSVVGPLVCGGRVDLSMAVFGLPVTLEIAARELVCERTRWESTATVRVRYAAVDLRHAVLSAPVAVIAHPAPFTGGLTGTVVIGEDLLTGSGRVRVVSVQGVDAAHLVLTDTDLTGCLFSEAFHLDQIRLEGRTTFAPPPAGWHRRGLRPVRFTRRRTLAEEHHWRAHTALQPALAAGEDPQPHLWRPGLHHTDPARVPHPEDVAALYRQLRKAFEDGKNEPGAADFYYGECEMRRHDLTGTPKSERRLLWGYWLLSGYGLRASRAFAWLLAAMSLTVLCLMAAGLPTHDPDPATTGTLSGSRISLDTSTPDPALHGGWSQRMTWPRTEKATRVAINSVVFRSGGQNLTNAGTYIEMASRLLEPTLLALCLLAIRGRIKR
ncbi:pentapeptide repeat-containing protein [Streptomyces sp. NPDC002755]|uniref:pentapeptide repeat-containing protein n=1 Tax=Streptomyces sp. NPDC002884 TaxID=3154544 RepID=UPI003325F85E